MKKTIFTFAALLFGTTFLLAQNPIDQCGTAEYLKQQIKSNPGLENKILIYNKQIREYLKQNKSSTKRSVITIPVVVHVIYSDDTQNISDQRIYDQIAITNRDFAGLNPHSMGAFPPSMKANAGIQLCLARVKPDGSATNGIDRRKTKVNSFIMNDDVKYDSSGGVDAWDPARYLNIWVCNFVMVDNLGYKYSAFAQFPSSGLNETYGVVIRFGAMGPTDSTYYRGNGGILTHEFGHCLNLSHIWGDDDQACTGTDFCDDSPNQAGRTTGVHSGILTDNCTKTSPGIMYMNFMDYSNDIVFANFTPDQVDRMQANFVAGTGKLIPLSTSNVCSPIVGISQELIIPELQVFPNPAKEQVTISCYLQNAQTIELNLLDIFGRIIRSEKFTSEQSENSIVLDLKQVTKGLYHVELIINGQKRGEKKLIIE